MENSTDFKELETIYEQNKDFLFSKFLYLTGSSDEAYDLIQAVFLKLIPYFRQGKIKSVNKSFLYKVGYNIFSEDFNKRKNRNSRDIQYFMIRNGENREEPETDNILEIVNSEIENLDVSERMKISLRMRLYAENSLQEIAEASGVSVRTVIRDLNAGLERLKEKLKKKGIGHV
ncbi:MAG TPA: sigma-70 family RNA polymerase sigma factor [Leptospiraceae bacterium]|nr:sigma-70 family RNA polymerase sigma factor [Leptospiraceae bacterium]HMY65761.1 sigma-70 family RNA polymerase sigma factor [Leptospiraceae bacterium]HMZ57260.1 sigma-70 family RNA polymerase sigma factor [Leptospiraceae bacterium]HNF13916.1 sigma-70 family RNA polymerase sigma factor [Leptospiraceae bacterium]HNF24489.1 sigma-70 family RNA polymerase sigma factor [Leptospiraceae bacterium]